MKTDNSLQRCVGCGEVKHYRIFNGGMYFCGPCSARACKCQDCGAVFDDDREYYGADAHITIPSAICPKCGSDTAKLLA